MKLKSALAFLLAALAMTVCLLLVLCSCDPPTFVYRGENKALYTAASNSVFAMTTNEMDRVLVLEKDDYGRSLYLVRANACIASDTFVAALLISQRDSESDVSYYEYDNVIYRYTDFFSPSETDVISPFTEDDISKLKEQNDWGKELNFEKMTTKSICTSDAYATLVSEAQLNVVRNVLFGSDSNVFFDPMTQYSNGKAVYHMTFSPSLENGEDESYILVFLPEATQQGRKYVYEKIEDLSEAQKQLDKLVRP